MSCLSDAPIVTVWFLLTCGLITAANGAICYVYIRNMMREHRLEKERLETEWDLSPTDRPWKGAKARWWK